MGTDVVTVNEVTQEQVEIIKATICKEATPAEMKLYFYDCERQGVHPLDRLVHFTKRGGKYTPVTSIDFFRMRAGDTSEHMGTTDPTYTGTVGSDGYTAHVTVYRWVKGEKCGFEASARWDAYFPGDQQGFMWKKMPELMLGKCAEALALRKAFPRQLHGLYTKDEMEQADRQAPKNTAPLKDRLVAQLEPVQVPSAPGVNVTLPYTGDAIDTGTTVKSASAADTQHPVPTPTDSDMGTLYRDFLGDVAAATKISHVSEFINRANDSALPRELKIAVQTAGSLKIEALKKRA